MTAASFQQRTILIGDTGSIAAYKACELVRECSKRGATVHVLMTRHATQFVTPLTFQTLSRNPVTSALFDQITDWQPGHVSLAERADALAIAPATANIIAKLAHGLADDALSTTALACRAPLIIAPAMNTAMLAHPATQANLALLRERGAVIVASDTGDLACGTVGAGRLAPLEQILEAIAAALAQARRGTA
jgi:phosphopantothenoylcysteine synthetase/decarboxylase